MRARARPLEGEGPDLSCGVSRGLSPSVNWPGPGVPSLPRTRCSEAGARPSVPAPEDTVTPLCPLPRRSPSIPSHQLHPVSSDAPSPPGPEQGIDRAELAV